jgi:hypothetical protein
MIGFQTRVLNGLPVHVEADICEGRYGDLEPINIGIYWTKRNKLGMRKQATVIEKKMTENDWDCLRDDILDVAYGRWIG